MCHYSNAFSISEKRLFFSGIIVPATGQELFSVCIVYILTAFMLAVFAQSTPGNRALYCPAPPVPEALKIADAVFIGEVVEIIKPLTPDPKAPLPGCFYTIRFRVEKAWKGINALEINVMTPMTGYEAMPVPKSEGDKYLVYAYYADTPEGAPSQWLLMGTMCNRTLPLSKAGDDIKELEAIENSCGGASSGAQEIYAPSDPRGSLKLAQETLRLPWYVLKTSNDIRSLGEMMLGEKKDAVDCRVCCNQK